MVSTITAVPVLKQYMDCCENSWTVDSRARDFSILMRVTGNGFPPGPVTVGCSTSS